MKAGDGDVCRCAGFVNLRQRITGIFRAGSLRMRDCFFIQTLIY